MPEDDQTGLRVATAQAELEQDRQDCSNNSAKCKKGGSFSPPIARKTPPQVHRNQRRNQEPHGTKTTPKKNAGFRRNSREDSGCWLEQQLRLGGRMGTRGWIGVEQRRTKKMRTRRGYKPTSEHKSTKKGKGVFWWWWLDVKSPNETPPLIGRKGVLIALLSFVYDEE